MKIEFEFEFKPGDVVWRKNLVTDKAYQVTITRVTVIYGLEKGKESYCVMYHTGDDGPMCNIPGKVDANNAFATEEAADACPPYVPSGGQDLEIKED